MAQLGDIGTSMADMKAGPVTVAESQAPTTAGSSANLSKVSQRDAPLDVEDTIAERIGTIIQHQDTESEKHNDLAQHATAATQASHSTCPRPTRTDDTEYPTGVKLGLISLALCLSVFLMALDNSIIATAIPKITDQFKSLPDVGWYGSAYLLTTAALQLLYGKFYTFFSVKLVYLVAIGIFEVGSLICGIANSSVILIIGRATAGAGSAGIFSGALIILAYSVPLEKRPMYGGFIGSMFAIASLSGPVLGGVFTDKFTWRWCFLINLPIGAITILVLAFLFPDPKRKINKDETWAERIKQFDPIGTAVFMPAIICLLLALQWGGTQYEWKSWRIIVLFVFFSVLILIFLIVQYKQQDLAAVPPRIFFNRTVLSSSFYSFCIGSAFLGLVYFLPVWLQAVKGASAVTSGIMNLPLLISMVVMSIIAGIAVTVLGYYAPFMIFSSVLTTIGFGLFTTFRPDTGSPVWIGYQILAGAGIGFGMPQPLIAVQTVLEIADVPTGTSVIVFVQTLGGALFVSIGQNVFTNKLVEYVGEYVPGLNPLLVLATGATFIQTDIPKDMLPGVTLAYNDALTRTFLVFAAMAAASIIGSLFVEWKSVKSKKIEIAAA